MDLRDEINFTLSEYEMEWNKNNSSIDVYVSFRLIENKSRGIYSARIIKNHDHSVVIAGYEAIFGDDIPEETKKNEILIRLILILARKGIDNLIGSRVE